MALLQIDWTPSPGGLRRFGAVMIAGFGLLGAAFYFGWPVEAERGTAIALWIAGAACGVLGLTGTRAALPVYWAWMGVAFVMGNIVSRIILGLVFFLVITPMGLAMRIAGRDRLLLKRKGRETYWFDVEHVTAPERYERQF